MRWAVRQLRRIVLLTIGVFAIAISFYAIFDPWTTPYMIGERSRLGDVDFQWVPLEDVAPPVMARSVVAAEDADFCAHWGGFDMGAIRAAIEEGGGRGASTSANRSSRTSTSGTGAAGSVRRWKP